MWRLCCLGRSLRRNANHCLFEYKRCFTVSLGGFYKLNPDRPYISYVCIVAEVFEKCFVFIWQTDWKAEVEGIVHSLMYSY